MEFNSRLITATVSILVGSLLLRFGYKLYLLRARARKLPGPPHSWIFGSIPIFAAVTQIAPKLVAPQNLFYLMKDKYKLGDIYVVDLAPIGPQFLVCNDPQVSQQFTVAQSLPKDPMLADFTDCLAGRSNLVTDEGAQWRLWRRAFNPGFSLSHLLTLVPEMTKKVGIWVDILEQHAKTDELFRLEHHATRLTIDIIGLVTLDLDFGSQKGEDELVSAFEHQVQIIPIQPWDIPMPYRRYMMWKNARTMKRYLARALQDRFASRASRNSSKFIVDLAFDAYMKEKGLSGKEATTLDPDFQAAAIDQIRVFIFAGHDTSSAAICYSIYHLNRNPKALAAARRELDYVFGPDVSRVAEKISAEPHLLNKLDYIAAAVKEALRMHPPASALRRGTKDFFLVDPKTNERYPTEGLSLFALNIGHHYDSKWGDPTVFRPERWLADEWREGYVPFSRGPRNCIGQELALMEIKLVLAMTLRTFEFQDGFGELDKLKNDGSGYPSDTSGVQELYGEQAYQIQLGTAKPREGMPGRVRLVGEKPRMHG